MENGRITTHVLDLSEAVPAAGMRVELWRLSTGLSAASGSGMEEPALMAEATLNGDGRPALPLAEGNLSAGIYELRFHAGDYFGEGRSVFLDLIPVRFRVKQENSHYHVPLLVSPGGYSTYRGS